MLTTVNSHPTGPSLDGPVHPTGLGPVELALSRTSLDAMGPDH
jgi:hypothetical protein